MYMYLLLFLKFKLIALTPLITLLLSIAVQALYTK